VAATLGEHSGEGGDLQGAQVMLQVSPALNYAWFAHREEALGLVKVTSIFIVVHWLHSFPSSRKTSS
jgi:hypothetical protein